MAKQPNDDLFEATTMTFGQHLEELRAALFKALAGLVVGVLVGLSVASSVVEWIQTPLTNALEEYYYKKAVSELKAKYPELNTTSTDPTTTKKENFIRRISNFFSLRKQSKTTEIEKFIRRQKVTYDEIYVEDSEFVRIQQLLAERRKLLERHTESGNPPDFETIADELVAPTENMVKVRIWKPLDANVTSLSVHETFMIWLKAAVVTGIVITSPWLFWQIWLFVAAGLYPHEKRYVWIYLPFSVLLFLSGVALAFFFVFKPVLDFLFTFNSSMNIDPDPRISEWMSFVLFLPLGFGISFQLPLVMLFLQRIGVLSVEAYISKWRIAILVIFVISMLLTPADPTSMLLMALPLSVLYVGGILLCRWMPRGRNPFGEQRDP